MRSSHAFGRRARRSGAVPAAGQPDQEEGGRVPSDVGGRVGEP